MDKLIGLKKKKFIFLCVAIFCIQILIWIACGSKKCNMYQDELYSLGYAQNCTGVGEYYTYFTDTPNWKEDSWLETDSFIQEITLQPEETVFQAGFPLKYFVTRYSYQVLLNIVGGIGGIGSNIVYWPYFALNVVIIILTELLIVWLLRRLKFSEKVILLSIFSYGTAVDMISWVCYIRFYIWALFLVWCVIVLNYCLLTSENLLKAVLFELLSCICTVMAIGNTYLSAVVCGCIILGTCIMMLLQKKMLNFYLQFSVIIGGIIYVLKKTGIFSIIFHFSDYASGEHGAGVAQEYTENIVNMNRGTIHMPMCEIADWFSEYRFCNKYVMVTCVILLSIWYLFCKYIKGNKWRDVLRWYNALYCMSVVAISYSVLSMEKHHIVPFAAFFCIALIVMLIENSDFTWRKLKDVKEGYCCIIAITCGVYFAFCIIASFMELRYYSFGFVLMWLLVWYVIDYLLNSSNKDVGRIVSYGIIAFLCIRLVFLYYNRNVMYIYEEDKEILDELASYSDVDSLLIGPKWLTSYDCVYNMNENTMLYVHTLADNENYSFIDSLDREEFLLWTNRNLGLNEECFDEFITRGYKYALLGNTHISSIYYFEK